MGSFIFASLFADRFDVDYVSYDENGNIDVDTSNDTVGVVMDLAIGIEWLVCCYVCWFDEKN